MKTQKPNAEQFWKQLDDLLVPRLQLGPIDRAAYCYLLRHSRLESKRRLHFSMPWLARGICLCTDAAGRAVRRLIDHRVLRLIERSTIGHVVDVRLPEEVLADHPEERAPRPVTLADLGVNLEDEDFLRNKALRHAIYAREGGRCFYCLRPLTPLQRCGAWTTSSHAPSRETIPTATSSPAAASAMLKKANAAPTIFSVRSSANAS
jgi:hypothetical protein